MSKYIFSYILDGLSFEHDFVATWLPILQNSNVESEEQISEISKLGAVSLAMIGIAAVEQNAKNKTLKNGTVQHLRLRAFTVQQTALTQTIFENAQLKILEMLADQKPQLTSWVENVTNEIRDKKQQIKQTVIRETIRILGEIEGQHFRKGQHGRQNLFGGKGRKPAHHIRDHIDAEILSQAISLLPVSKQKSVDAIRPNLRQIAKDFIIRGILPVGAQTLADATDKHAKRLYRKLAILTK